MCKRKLSQQDPPARNAKRLKTFLSETNPLPGNDDTPMGEQITMAQGFLAQIQSEIGFIDNLKSGQNPFQPEFTPRTAKTAVSKKQKPLQDWLHELLTQQQREQNLAAVNLIPGDSGSMAGDGNLYIQFINIGLGDCTLITTPQGTRIMVDCGNDGATKDIVLNPAFKGTTPMNYVRNQIKNEKFLNGRNTVDILLLTHTDRDHHNKIKTILNPLAGIRIGITYYGGTEDFGDYATSAAFIRQKCGDTLAHHRKVIIREDENNKKNFTQSINDTTVLATSGTPRVLGKEFIDPVSKAMVIYFEKDENMVKSDFKLSLLVGNATGAWKDNKFVINDAEIKGPGESKGSGSEENQRSLMILVECFGEKTLICGDATAVSERVAINHSKTLLGKVTSQRIGHHGSPTSSSKDFVNALTSAKLAVASTGGLSLVKHHLPQYPILNLYTAMTNTGNPKPPSHTIFAWNELQRENLANIQNNLWATGSNDTYELKAAPPG